MGQAPQRIALLWLSIVVANHILGAIMLTPLQTKFVREWCKDLDLEGKRPNATECAIRAGCPQAGAAVTASRWLKDPKIVDAIQERQEELAAAAGITTEWVLRQWRQIVEADDNDLTQLRRVCCRHCHGFGHQYQWTEAEYMAAVNKAIDAAKPAPDGMGGFGYDLNAEPHPECPECGGLGQELVHVMDTRKLNGGARRLYAGVQKTKEGLKVLTRDKDAALANISRYLGMTVDRKEISGPGGGPVPLAHITADDLTDDQLAAILKADEEGAE